MSSQLFTPFSLRGLTLPNRVVVAPMCQYSAEDGNATGWHVMHWGQYAVAAAGLVMVEATGVEPRGRITPGCLGLWSDENEAAMAEALSAARKIADVPFGIQLGHAGRKASAKRPWEGPGHYWPGDGGWSVAGPSEIPFAEDWPVPEALGEEAMADIIDAFAASAVRAVRLGFQCIEIHAAHGYLLSSFLSPIANRRDDSYGGSLENRARLPMQVFHAVREAVPDTFPVGVRFNGTDWLDGGFSADDAVGFARMLADAGCDFVDVSSGGNAFASIPVGPGYQVPVAERIRREIGIATMAVGMIRSPQHAEAIVANGQADLVAIGRGFLNDPRWVWHAAEALNVELNVVPQYRFGATSVYRPTPGR
jgi:2,4-dienoyl-CoA reductase-like NADH-dependent reductase (Old Yellow Enzyme family)